jgi:NAD+ kinase
MKFGIFVHPKRPKVRATDVIKVFKAAGVCYSKTEPDIAIVVGGDGTFGYYGRTLSMPMLFVGVKDPSMLGSKSRLAETIFDNLPKNLNDIRAGRYQLEEERMLTVEWNGHREDVLTDVYLERGAFAGCLRYVLSVRSKKSTESGSRFTDYAIGNGVIVSTSFGSTGYYSYPERIEAEGSHNGKVKRFGKNEIGVCHVLPLFLKRERNGKKVRAQIRYTIPSNSIIEISLMREADARLYGVSRTSKGVPIGASDKVRISQSNKTARIVRL